MLRDQPVLYPSGTGPQSSKYEKESLRALERYTISSNIDALEQLYADLMQTSTVAA